jgi:hypothetical protein
MSVVDWLTRCKPIPQQRSHMLGLVSKALCQTGPTPSDARGMVHSQHVHHLSLMALNDFPEHFSETVSILLSLTEKQSLDPAVWTHLSRATMMAAVTGDRTMKTPMPRDVRMIGNKVDEWKMVMREFVIKEQLFRIKEVVSI